jgi:hypothetical protein
VGVAEGGPAVTATLHAERQQAVSCPRCGGVPDPAGGSGHLARCRSCGVLGRIHDPEGRQRLAALPAIAPEFAGRSVEQDSGGSRIGVEACELVFVPFWRLSSLIVGSVRGQRRRTRKSLERLPNDNGQTLYQWVERDDGTEDVDEDAERHHVAVVSACPLDELGIPTLDRYRQGAGRLGVRRPLDRLGEVVPFEASLRHRGTVLDPIVTAGQASEEADALVEQQERGFAGGLLPGAQVNATVIARDRVLLFYPVYLVRFRQAGLPCDAVVDAVSGTVVSQRAPETSEVAHDRRLVSLAGLLAGLVAGSLAHLALWSPPWIAGAEAAGVRAGLLLLATGVVTAAWLGGRQLPRLAGRNEP